MVACEADRPSLHGGTEGTGARMAAASRHGCSFMHALVVVANPNPGSFNAQMAALAVETLSASGRPAIEEAGQAVLERSGSFLGTPRIIAANARFARLEMFETTAACTSRRNMTIVIYDHGRIT